MNRNKRVNVKPLSSLFLISYSDVRCDVEHLQKYKIHLYIDIPTIDYYTDELTETKLSKLNKKLKLSKLKHDIWRAFYNGDEQFWDRLKESNHQVKVTVDISSSGSLRYVQTIKFLLETIYNSLRELEYVQLQFHLDSTLTSLKWFKTFLDPELMNAGIIKFNTIKHTPQQSDNTKTPFKEYYMRLNNKFMDSERYFDKKVMETIVIVTNQTGVKALLTLLSDRPLNSYISEESMKALQHMSASATRNRSYSATVPNHSYETDFISHTPLKRVSSSILNFQNESLPLSHEKEARVKSPISLATSPTLTNSRSFTPIDFPGAESYNSRAMSPDDLAMADALSDEFDEDEDNYEDEEFDEDDDNDDDDNDPDEGLSFFAPNILSRSGSGFNLSSRAQNNINNKLKLPGTSKGRFRSLSLMDPALNRPFMQKGLQMTPANTGLTVKDNRNELRCASPLASTVTKFETNSNNNNEDTHDDDNNDLHKKFTNIYIHDGDFDEVVLDDSTQQRILHNKKKLMEIHGEDTGTRISNTPNSLIPPEFYSRLSSPSTSASSSNTSLTQLNTLVTPQFTKWLNNANLLHSQGNDKQSQIKGGANLFEQKLVKKSMEDLRNEPAKNFINGLINGDIDSTEKNAYALNFRNTANYSQHHYEALDDEDRMMSGVTEDHDNTRQSSDLTFESSTTSESEDETATTASVATIKPEMPSAQLFGLSNSHNSRLSQTSKTSLDQIRPSFSFQLYDDLENIDNQVNEQIQQNPDSEPPKAYKKAVSIDLYGDEDPDNNDTWLLGWNNK
ncbi:Hypothetical protein J6898_01471 [Nakaseomyces glabratus]